MGNFHYVCMAQNSIILAIKIHDTTNQESILRCHQHENRQSKLYQFFLILAKHKENICQN